ncbi:DUF3231 family protein [Neobacillus mesonae]|uniref:DUF3231 family protein n=1 Tax=Neobacillus mesonae TaxID=1193713 RepID=UPI00203D4CAC|nr:DUF3231 family protein [Neobacillus mesonae]MCM3569503.1 DUF3231 family protein [Neobacillus mesonae]
MDIIKPIELGSTKSDLNEKLTAVELGKLWATYMGNSMAKCILQYYLQHCDDKEIRVLLENALYLSTDFVNRTTDIFKKENIPLPQGFTEEDVNLGAPRLFEDQFYVHYLKYTAKAGMSIYNVAIPLVFRKDVREFFIYCMHSTMELIEQIKDILMNKGFIIKPPTIPTPNKVEFIKSDFLNGFFGTVRPLHALEIAHFYDNIENNATSKALIMAFAQVVKSEKIRKLFVRGKEITHKSIDRCVEKLNNESLPSPTLHDHLVTTSTYPPFSDKLMLFHKMDMFSMKIRSYGNAMAVNGRHDIGMLYTRDLVSIGLFVEEAVKIMIENGWFEKPPYAVERDKLSSK